MKIEIGKKQQLIRLYIAFEISCKIEMFEKYFRLPFCLRMSNENYSNIKKKIFYIFSYNM